MNKKVSTLLTMGLFLGGSLFNIVSAEDLTAFIKGGDQAQAIGKLESGKQYFLGIGGQYLHSTVADGAITYKFVGGDEDVAKENLQEYLWTVTEAPQGDGTVGYTFANAKSGEQIYFVCTNNVWAVSDDPEQKTEATSQNIFVWVDAQDQLINDQKDEFVAASVKAIKKGQNPDVYFGNNNQEFIPSQNTVNVTLYSIADGINVDVDGLNDLYNSAGFNFALNDDKLASVTNIFGDKRVVALNVNGAFKDPNDPTIGFPRGTYFATSVPYLWDYQYADNDNDGVEETPTSFPSYNYLVQCTFIAVDSDSNIADDADVMKAGDGFTLTEVSGKDLVLYLGTEDKFKAQGNQIAVRNAVFAVQESATSDVYKLTVPTVRALEKAGAEKQVETPNHDVIASEDYAQIVTGANSASGNFIFKFAESTVEKGISFLKKEAAPSIYNIKFYLKNGADDSYNAKYLTMDATGANFIAKGAVLADLDAPAYQWLISKVDGNNVTFTNRETGETLETQLFKEDGGRFSLSPKGSSVNNQLDFDYYIVNAAGNVVLGGQDINLQGAVVELIESEAVSFSNYLDVEDGSVMTLSFGRDIAPTSNKLYPAVSWDNTNRTYVFNDGNGNSMTGDVSLAAQWRLVKARNANGVIKTNGVTYNYAYANGDLVNIKNNGDAVYAYSYNLELVLDGNPLGVYLKMGTSNWNPATGTFDEENNDPTLIVNAQNIATEFFIQENVDGSVLMKDARKSGVALFVQDYFNGGTIGDYENARFFSQGIFNNIWANDIKTYLIAEAPAVSLPGNEGHYSIASTDGNYITMNDERDAMTVKEASEPLYLYVGDKEDVTPSFYITKAAQNKAERMFLFNPADSIRYYVAEGQYDKEYQLVGGQTKAIFKAAAINETRDTLTTNIKGVSTLVATEANNSTKVSGGLNRFKMQVLESDDADGTYVIRQKAGAWLRSLNGTLVWGNKVDAMKFDVEGAEAPTSNESVAASEVKVIANDGAVVVKNAAGKNVVVSTILGQVVANEVLTSDNATINVPAGIVVVAVDGESFKVNVK